MNDTCCKNDERRLAVLQHPCVNGIDFIEVMDNPADPDDIRQTELAVHFLKDIEPAALQPSNILITGGERIKNISVVWATRADLVLPASPGASANVLMVKLTQVGDFSVYHFQLVDQQGVDAPPEGFDPLLSGIDFSFKVSCPGEFDCATTTECAPPERIKKPLINYLAKDYASFRQLMLDRMALTIPAWKERNPADMGIMLVELLAYVGDYLSYRQDAIATEAYLGTARKRISVKRHARLVDYHMHDGCNARTWVHIEVAEGISDITLKGNKHGNSLKFVTKVPGKDPIIKHGTSSANELFNGNDYEVFEPVHDLELDSRLNKLFFYTWGKKICHLKKGATTATIDGHINDLEGKILVIQEELNPHKLNRADADITKRHAIKVLTAKHDYDILYDSQTTPPNPEGRGITEISWGEEDKLPFPFCINTIDPLGEVVVTSSILGNIVLADHGNSITEELQYSAGKKQPVLSHIPLTIGLKYRELSNLSASAMLSTKLQQYGPMILLKEKNIAGLLWDPVPDLISSEFNSRHFVVETEDNGITQLRFGNDLNGQKPVEDLEFLAIYRVGNGTNGNIAVNALTHLVSNDVSLNANTILSVRNVIAGTGGVEPETIEEVKYRAPIAFRQQERAVTTGDYEEKARMSNKNIQRSAATLRWTGSWRTVFLSVDTFAGQALNDRVVAKIKEDMEKYRMAGQDLEIEKPDYVPLEIEIDVCVQPNYSRSDVKLVILQNLSNLSFPNGEKGVFHPDNFTFGQPVYLSKLYSVIQKQAGVASVTIKKFQRLGINNSEALNTGKLLLGRTEIARLDNNPNALENGVLSINMSGGN